jgi:penicillin amidase
MTSFRKILFLLLLAVIFALPAGSVTSETSKKEKCPGYDGELVIPGLTGEATVYRDIKGMPHVYAGNEHDLYLAAGFISAQERLWQMDLIRRSSTGRLSEIFGKSFIQTDMFARFLRIKEKSRMVIEKEDVEILNCMQAYADGVNAFIRSAGRKLPVEFRILSYEPEEWKLEDIANTIGFLGWNLATRNLTSELFNYQLIKKLGAVKASQLIPEGKTLTDLVYPDFILKETLINDVRSIISSSWRIAELGITPFSGSNNWAVSGSRTETGKPFLSNDTHLSLTCPGIWMQMHQVIPGKLNVTGALIPGQPFVVIGHNEKIAWGATNMMVDDVDLFAEKINPENLNQYYFNGEWKNMENVSEIIKVRKGHDDTLNIKLTHRGPIISGLKETEDISLSMRWSGYDFSDEIKAVYLLNRAGTWDDFRTGLKVFRSINQNFAYADVDGNIGLQAGGGIPVRKGPGIMIRNGETDEYDWKGYVPFDKLPSSFNPVNGYVVSANNKTVTDDYPYYISSEFALPYRLTRIRQMLDEKDIFKPDDFISMINDQHSDFAGLLVPLILRLNTRSGEFMEL